ncbi:T9SS type A sorting domain-containing protein [Hymenobacter sp. BRD128]|uniref:T9SS type A sorting domain-containing protein n=1 Tax=Hymenobacter sp. BRD128 TaxID=2675878 RepID=UPI0015673E9E|nr:T9SS type A sorting domain-containing protein [Hymenobacter sp. BRD128]QKG58224.1 T9SS type A sorting domain-containing protein [Hymenobacter sp. BRD128]
MRDGNLSDPSIYAGFVAGCTVAPTGTNNITINNNVVLDQDFAITSGSLTINATGTLSQAAGALRTLSINNKGNGSIIQLIIVAATPGVRSKPQLSVGILDLSRTTLNIGSGATVQVCCTVFMGTQVTTNLGNNSLLNVLGNIDVATASSGVAGPPKAAGGTPAGVRVYSNLVDNHGGAKSLFQTSTNLVVCVQGNQLSTSCPPSSAAIFNVASAGIFNDPTCLSVLPVTLTRFSGSRTSDGGHVSLNWATASEVNNAFFAVERSTDAQTFDVLGQVAGAGTSSTARAYTFLDEYPLASTTYYRLRQVDLDGTSTFSPVVTIAESRTSADWLLCTAPQHYVVQGSGELHVLDVMGRSLFTQTLLANKSEVVLPALPTGVYFFQLLTAKGRSTIRQ